MSRKEIQERHDEINSQYRVFYVDAAPAHKDRGKLLDALREIGELPAYFKRQVGISEEAKDMLSFCASILQSKLDKL